MTSIARALRVLLCAVIALGSPAQAARMPAPAMMSAPAAMPCRDAAMGGVHAHASSASSDSSNPSDSSVPHPATCCAAGDCHCVGAIGIQVPSGTTLATTLVVRRVAWIALPGTSHVSPFADRSLRPPIAGRDDA